MVNRTGLFGVVDPLSVIGTDADNVTIEPYPGPGGTISGFVVHDLKTNFEWFALPNIQNTFCGGMDPANYHNSLIGLVPTSIYYDYYDGPGMTTLYPDFSKYQDEKPLLVGWEFYKSVNDVNFQLSGSLRIQYLMLAVQLHGCLSAGIRSLKAVDVTPRPKALRIPRTNGFVPPSITELAPTSGADTGLTLELTFEQRMSMRAFQRKHGQLRFHIAKGDLTSNVPHGVSDSARRALTRAYRRALVDRINNMYKHNPTARDNALRQLADADIDHIHDLQLDGQNVVSNLKALHSYTNQRLGSQIFAQLPNGQRVRIVAIVVKGVPQ